MEKSRKHNDNSSISHLSELKISTSDTHLAQQIVDVTPEINSPEILFIEPFYTGSHKQLIDLLHKSFPKGSLITLSGKKWPWRARCSALILSSLIPQFTEEKTEKVLFCSSVVSLAELVGLRPDLQHLKKVVYFHENQFVYPIRQIKERDIQFAYNQITTCLAADLILFNSNFNLKCLLDNLNKIVHLLPDYRPKDLQLKIQPKCKVLYFPVEYPQLNATRREKANDYLTIVWPHRWEFDKGPDVFINILLKLNTKLGEYGSIKQFRVHLLGGHFEDVPDILCSAKETLKDQFLTLGFVECKEDYYEVLRGSDIVMSTAIHEFFGVAMLEATYCGCFPLAPNNLVYPEIYPAQCLYNDVEEAVEILFNYCLNPSNAAEDRSELKIDFGKYSKEALLPQFEKVLQS